MRRRNGLIACDGVRRFETSEDDVDLGDPNHAMSKGWLRYARVNIVLVGRAQKSLEGQTHSDAVIIVGGPGPRQRRATR